MSLGVITKEQEGKLYTTVRCSGMSHFPGTLTAPSLCYRRLRCPWVW